jgi:hypothetical protein
MKLRNLLALLLPLLLFSSCKDMTRGKDLSEAAIVEFHHQFNELKFKEIYVAGNADLKAAATEEDLVKLLQAVHKKLGAQVKSSNAGWRVNSFNMKTSVVLSMNTEFEHGKGVETFTYIVSGESCTLQSYHIDSKDMMLK